MEKLKIVNFEEKHLNDCAQIEKQSFSDPWTLEQLKESIKNPLSLFLTAEVNGELAAYIGLYIIKDEAQILNIAVKENYRRNGIGKALIIKAEKKAKLRGAKKLTLELRKSNTAAQNLYNSCGFLIDGTRKDFYANPQEDAILMHKSIDN